MGDVIMTNKEINQIDIFEKLVRKEIKQKVTSQLLGISTRRVRRKLHAYKIYGAKSLVHKSRGRTSNNKINQSTLDQAVTIIKNQL